MMKSLMTALFVATLSSVGGAATLYDVTFSSPLNTLGQPAVVGESGPLFKTPSALKFGTSQVVASGGGLNEQPLLLIPGTANTFIYSQYEFDISAFDRSPIYRIDMDVSLSMSPGDNFALHFDTPTSTPLRFETGNRITTNLGLIGTFTQDVPFHLSILLNLPDNKWTIAIDGNQLFDGQFFRPIFVDPTPPTELRSLRINLSDSTTFPGVPLAYVDNIRVSSVPEPGTVLFGIALLGLALLDRRRPN